MNKTILLLIQGSGRSIYFESFALELRSRGYRIIIGSMCMPGPIQEYFSKEGFECVDYDVPRSPLPGYYLKHSRFWKKLVKKEMVEVVFSHLQWANFVALMLNFWRFKKVCVIPTRHHIDASFLFNSKKRKMEDAAINFFASKQVVVSEHAKIFMLKNEWFARKSDIHFIPLGYDFNLYKGLELDQSAAIKEQYKCKFLLLTAARLVKTKRHSLVINAMKMLSDKGLDIKLLVLDNGPELDELSLLTKNLGIDDKVFFLGNKMNISDYIKAADLLIQPSVEESSNQVLKEAAYYYKTAVVTKGIGDFDDYVIDKKNAFFISKENSAGDLAALVETIYEGKYDLNTMASELRKDVLARFDIKHTIDQYLKLAGLNP